MKGIRILSFICVMLLGLRIQSFANSQNENDSVLIAKKNFNIVYTNDIDLCSDLVNVNFVKAFQHLYGDTLLFDLIRQRKILAVYVLLDSTGRIKQYSFQSGGRRQSNELDSIFYNSKWTILHKAIELLGNTLFVTRVMLQDASYGDYVSFYFLGRSPYFIPGLDCTKPKEYLNKWFRKTEEMCTKSLERIIIKNINNPDEWMDAHVKSCVQ